MGKYITVIFALFLSACQSSQATADNNDPKIIANTSGERTWYHATLSLSEEDFSLNERYGFVEENGQFELYLKPEDTGVATPDCEKRVIVRMPATLSDDPDPEASIEEKRRQFNALRSVQEGESSSQSITVEFNPYVRVLSESPLELALTRCTIFFRAHQGRYIDHTGPLSSN